MPVTRQREHGTMEHWPKTPEERITAFRQIVKDKAYAKIDGTMVDLFTANYVVQIYDALNDKNRAKFSTMIAPRMGQIAFHWPTEKRMKFILWDPRDNYQPRRDEEGNEIISDGILGRVTEDNVYLQTYAEYPGEKRPSDLQVGEAIKRVVFRLSKEQGVYDVWRVE